MYIIQLVTETPSNQLQFMVPYCGNAKVSIKAYILVGYVTEVQYLMTGMGKNYTIPIKRNLWQTLIYHRIPIKFVERKHIPNSDFPMVHVIPLLKIKIKSFNCGFSKNMLWSEFLPSCQHEDHTNINLCLACGYKNPLNREKIEKCTFDFWQ